MGIIMVWIALLFELMLVILNILFKVSIALDSPWRTNLEPPTRTLPGAENRHCGRCFGSTGHSIVC